MPIVFRHDAAGIPLGKGDDTRSKYGMAMVGQQQKYDAEMRQGQQDAMYGMQRLEAMRGMQSAREPSLGEESAMMDNEIRSGLYDPDTVRALRDNERSIKLILRDRNLNATQQSEAIGNIRSQMRMMRSTGRVQPMMQAMPQGQGGQMPQPPSARQVFRQDSKTMERFMGIVQQQLDNEGASLSYEDKVRKALDLYETQQRLLSDPQPGQQAPPAAQPQGAPQSVGSANISGGSVFGVDPVLASPMPGGGQPQVGSQSADTSNVVMGGLPGAVSAPSQPAAPPRRGRPALIMPGQGIAADGIPQPGLQDLQALNARLRNESATQQQPQERVYGGPPAQPAVPQQQPPIYPMQAISGMQAQGQPLPMQGGGGVRNWTSADGKYSTQGELQSVLNQPGGEPVAVIKKSNGSVVNVPMSKLSVDDVDFALSGGNVQPVRPDTSNRDTMYDLQNRGRTPGTNFMDPNNPVRQEMSAADQSIVNPQRQTLGKPGGRYGLGQVDYGINPATGNRVTASIRPGGTAVEYDEPVRNVGKVGGGPAGQGRVVNTLGRKRPSASPGEATPSEQAAYNALPASPSSAAAQQQLPASAQSVPIEQGRGILTEPMRQFAQSQPYDIRSAIESFYDTKATGESKRRAAQFLLSNNVSLLDLEKKFKAEQGVAPTQQMSIDELNRRGWVIDGNGGVPRSRSGNTPNDVVSQAIRSIPSAVAGVLTGPADSGYPVSGPALVDRVKRMNKGGGGKYSPTSMQDLEDASPSASDKSGKYQSSGSAFSSDAGKQLAESTQQPKETKQLNSKKSGRIPSKPFVTTPEAKRFLADMQSVASQYDPQTSMAIMSVYDPSLSESARLAIVKRLQETGVNLPQIEENLKKKITKEMQQQRQLPNPRDRTNRRQSPQLFDQV